MTTVKPFLKEHPKNLATNKDYVKMKIPANVPNPTRGMDELGKIRIRFHEEIL